MGLNSKFMKNRLIAVLLSVAMILSIVTITPFTAFAVTTKIFEYENYKIIYRITGQWGHIDWGGVTQIIKIEIVNTGDEPIENWTLAFDDFMGDTPISDRAVAIRIASGGVCAYEEAKYLRDNHELRINNYILNQIRELSQSNNLTFLHNRGWNADIEPGGSIEIEYMLNNATGIPSMIDMAQKRVEKTSGFEVQLNIEHDWGPVFSGNIEITNTTDTPISWWNLTFSNNFTFDTVWVASLDEQDGKHLLKGAHHTRVIEPNSSVEIGFRGNKNVGIVPMIEVERFSEIVFNQNILQKQEIEWEDKVISTATIDDDFCPRTVLVVMDKNIGALDKVHDKSFFRCCCTSFPIEEIRDLTQSFAKRAESDPHLQAMIDSGEIELVPFQRNMETFRQILVLELPEESTKQDVLDAVAVLERVNGIISAEPNFLFSAPEVPSEYHDSAPMGYSPITDDTLYSRQWGLESINARKAWEFAMERAGTVGNSDVRVGVIDDVIAYHDDFGCKEAGTLIIDRDLGVCYKSNFDLVSHGTWVAGVISTIWREGGIIGVARNVTLVPFRIRIREFDYIDAIKQITAASIIDNTSLATGYTNETNKPIQILNYSSHGGATFSFAHWQIIRDYPGLFVAAAGNRGWDNDIRANYPANFSLPNLVTVGAIDKYNNRSIWDECNDCQRCISGIMCHSSHYGKNTVHLFAPGSAILTTDSNGRTRTTIGTSLAAPYVSGVAALILSVYPEATPEQIKKAILNGVDKLPQLENYCITGGKLNAYQALREMEKIIDERCPVCDTRIVEGCECFCKICWGLRENCEPCANKVNCGTLRCDLCKEFAKGDVNGDGKIDIMDALEILKYLSKLECNTIGMDKIVYCMGSWQAALIHPDSIRDGIPTIVDALEILKHLAVISPNFVDNPAPRGGIQ
jgi:hypothetical protein